MAKKWTTTETEDAIIHVSDAAPFFARACRPISNMRFMGLISQSVNSWHRELSG